MRQSKYTLDQILAEKVTQAIVDAINAIELDEPQVEKDNLSVRKTPQLTEQSASKFEFYLGIKRTGITGKIQTNLSTREFFVLLGLLLAILGVVIPTLQPYLENIRTLLPS